MTKLKFFAAVLTGTLFSCSSSDSDCNQIIEPQGNEVTARCNSYSMPLGRLNIDHSTEFETASCKLLFTNDENGNGFDYTDQDTNINLVDIWLIIPSEYTLLDEIPAGTYQLKNDLDSSTNEQYQAFDIADWNRLVIGARVNQDNNHFEDYEHLYGTEYDDITVNVAKNGPIYTIDYTMIYKGKTFKGKYVGELEVADTWL